MTVFCVRCVLTVVEYFGCVWLPLCPLTASLPSVCTAEDLPVADGLNISVHYDASDVSLIDFRLWFVIYVISK